MSGHVTDKQTDGQNKRQIDWESEIQGGMAEKKKMKIDSWVL